MIAAIWSRVRRVTACALGALVLLNHPVGAQPVLVEISDAQAAPGESIKPTLLAPPGQSWGVAMELGLDAIVIGSGVLDGSGRAQVAFAPFVGALADSSKIFIQDAVFGGNFNPFLPRPTKAIRNVAVAGAVLKQDEATSNQSIPVSIVGIFSGLATGPHTVSVWAAGANGGATAAQLNVGCWPGSDHIVLKELR
jgi:hypothetical protein